MSNMLGYKILVNEVANCRIISVKTADMGYARCVVCAKGIDTTYLRDDMEDFLIYLLNSGLLNEIKDIEPVRPDEILNLNYFHSYSDFSFIIGEDFEVRGIENNCGHTELWCYNSDILFKTIVIEQSAFNVFREMSPVALMYAAMGYLKKLFNDLRCREFKSLKEFIIALLDKN